MAGLVTRVVFVGASKKPNFVTETCPLPTAGELHEGEVLLKMRLATICHSDLETLEGKCSKPIPSVMGHEGVGEVLISKRRDLDLSPGDRVVFSSSTRCDICNICRRNLSVNCPLGVQYGHGPLSQASRLSGAFATHLILRRGTHIVKVPPEVADSLAGPANCPLVTMIHTMEVIATRLTGCTDKKIAVIQGANIFGIYGCLLLNEAGFSEVYVTDSSPDQQKMVPHFGGIPSFDRKDHRRRSRLPSPSTVDVVIQTNGQVDLMPEGIEMLRPGGMYLLVGVGVQHCNSTTLNSEHVIRKCLTIQGISGHQKHHLNMAMDFLARLSGTYPLQDLVSPKFSLPDLPLAIRTAKAGLYCRIAMVMENMRV